MMSSVHTHRCLSNAGVWWLLPASNPNCNFCHEYAGHGLYHLQSDRQVLNRHVLLCCRIIGDGNKNLQHIVHVFVKVLSHGNELAEPETAGHMVRLLSQMQGSLPPQVRVICSSSYMSPSCSVHQGAALVAGARCRCTLQKLFMSPGKYYVCACSCVYV